MTNVEQMNEIDAALRDAPTPPPSDALTTRVLGHARAALTENRRRRPNRITTALGRAAVVAAVAVYLSWAVDFLAWLART
ncbi:MAG TPA: hypothetical protein VHJ20_18875 [Polyangia bacterium]|nr:hypothetical protein [Polyangia bacterium]